MKGDFTRSTFDRGKHYSGVRMQQGRVQVDADWNEQADIVSYRDQIAAGDIIGPTGVPEQDGTYPGFKIGLAPGGTDLTIDPGRIYVNGVLCENEETANYLLQPDLSPSMQSVTTGRYLIYLDVWERHITAIEDSMIKEVALGGPDTGTRTKTVWQVKILSVPSGGLIDCDSQIGDFDQLSNKNLFGKLQARATPPAVNDPNTPCVLQPSAGYVGLENQLYRVEIHNPGSYFKADATHPSPPTFKWSRENGAIVVAIEQISGNQVKISSLGKDAVNSFKVGDYIELLNDSREINGQPGDLKQVTAIIESQRILVLDSNVDTGTFTTQSGNPKVRRWESVGGTMTTSGIQVQRPDANDGYLALESGIEVLFGDGIYHTGDYWLIPARTDNGAVEWPVSNGTPVARTRQGIEHNFCRLGLATYTSSTTTWSSVTDCRKRMVSLTNYPNSFYYVGGDGQEGLPAQTLQRSLQVGVANSQNAVKGARVKFTVTVGSGSLSIDSGYSGTPVSGGFVVFTDSQGIASCTFTLDSSSSSQQVTAVLVDNANNPLQLPPVRFNASISAASGVSYTPPQDCTKLTHVSTVQDALDQLCSSGSADCNTTIQIVDANFVTGPRLTYGLRLPFPMLQGGIRILFDSPIDPKSVNLIGFQFYLYLPFMFGCDPCASIWYGGAPDFTHPIGYTPLLVESTILPDSDPHAVIWAPNALAFQHLMSVMSTAAFPPNVQMLARLVLKGNFIWQQGAMTKFLGGKLLPTPTGYKFPVGDDCAIAGDIEIPFLFTPTTAFNSSAQITWISVDVQNLPCNSATIVHAFFDQQLAPGTVVPLNVQLTGDQSIYPNGQLQVVVGSSGLEATAQFAPSVASTLTTVKFSSNYGGGSASAVMNVYPCASGAGCQITGVPIAGLPGGNSFVIQYTINYPFATQTAIPFQSSYPQAIPDFVVTFPAGVTGTFSQQVQTLQFDSSGPVSVVLSPPNSFGTPCSPVLMLPRQQVALTGISITPSVFNPPNVSAGTVTITLDRVAPTGGIDVAVSSFKGYVGLPNVVHIPAGQVGMNGQPGITFNCNVQSVTVVENDTITASYGSSVVQTSVTIQPTGGPALMNVQSVQIGMIDSSNGDLMAGGVSVTDVNQALVIPFSNGFNGIRVGFSQRPDASSVNALTFTVALNGVQFASTAVQIVSVAPNIYVFSRSGQQVLARGNYTVNLIGTNGASGNQQAITYNTTLLDGNSKYSGAPNIPSGDGIEGGTFTFTFKVS